VEPKLPGIGKKLRLKLGLVWVVGKPWANGHFWKLVSGKSWVEIRLGNVP